MANTKASFNVTLGRTGQDTQVEFPDLDHPLRIKAIAIFSYPDAMTKILLDVSTPEGQVRMIEGTVNLDSLPIALQGFLLPNSVELLSQLGFSFKASS